jgi:hypothetical protein
VLLPVWRPVPFFEWRLERPSNWPLALAAPACCAVLSLLTGIVLFGKVTPQVSFPVVTGNAGTVRSFAVALSVLVSSSYFVYYAVLALAAVGVDVLLRDSGKGTRLAELVGFCFVPQIFHSASLLLLVVWWLPSPAALSQAMGPQFAHMPLEQYKEIVTSRAPFLVVQSLSYICWLWTICLIGVCLAVVSRIALHRVVMSLAALAAVCAALYVVRL